MICLLAIAAPLACSSTDQRSVEPPAGSAGTGPTSEGELVYQTALREGNSFACATCHALTEPSADGIRRPGHPIGDATRRTTWKNGKANSFLEAANSCVTEWMVAPAWSPSDADYLALYRFLDSRAPVQVAPAVPFDIVQPPSDVSGGDSERGLALFNQTCVVCHGKAGVGTIRGPRVAGSKRAGSYVAKRIRTSGSASSMVYDGLTGGVMPFWAKDRLSDSELRDLVAFVTSVGGAEGPGSAGIGQGGDAASGGTGGAGGSSTGGTHGLGDAGSESPVACGKTNPRVGWTADLGVNHGEGQVSGFVKMVDDCTLELSDFSYDGNGIDVRVYGSKNQSFRPGISLSDDLVGKTFSHQTLTIALPQGTTLDSLDWVSIWCAALPRAQTSAVARSWHRKGSDVDRTATGSSRVMARNSKGVPKPERSTALADKG
jgi:mono/diheme cytochrome c family protein